jgi:hypothetical protein
MKFSGIDPAFISQMLICVGKMPDGERINMLTTVFDKENLDNKPIIVFTHGYAASTAVYY